MSSDLVWLKHCSSSLRRIGPVRAGHLSYGSAWLPRAGYEGERLLGWQRPLFLRQVAWLLGLSRCSIAFQRTYCRQSEYRSFPVRLELQLDPTTVWDQPSFMD